jgi:DNA-binding response OmpR family regulator
MRVGVARVKPRTDKRSSTRGGAPARRRRRPVLFVVDDDVATIDVLREVAHDAGWIAHGFTRLAAVREYLGHTRPTLLILDDELPDGSGGDLARLLRDDARLADVPLVVCTAAHRRRRAEIGTWAPVVTKPFDLVEIQRYLDAAAGRQGYQSYGRVAG